MTHTPRWSKSQFHSLNNISSCGWGNFRGNIMLTSPALRGLERGSGLVPHSHLGYRDFKCNGVISFKCSKMKI